MSEQKHFNVGNVFGRVSEVKEDKSEGGKPYLQITVDVSGSKSGSCRAYCRMWGEQRCREFLEHYKKNSGGTYWMKGFFSQYQDRNSNWLSNFTVYQWEAKPVDPRAVFILKGEVSHQPSRTTDGGQRFLLRVCRKGENGYGDTEDSFELWAQGERLLDPVAVGNFCEIKGYVRQETLEGEFGESSGPIRAYVHELKVLA